LQPDREQDAGAIFAQRAFEQVEQFLVADFGKLAGAAGADQYFALRLLDEQAHLADEFAAVDVGEDQLAALVVLAADGDRAVDYVEQGIGGIAGAKNCGLAGVAATMALLEQSLHRGRIGRQHRGCLRAFINLLEQVA